MCKCKWREEWEGKRRKGVPSSALTPPPLSWYRGCTRALPTASRLPLAGSGARYTRWLTNWLFNSTRQLACFFFFLFGSICFCSWPDWPDGPVHYPLSNGHCAWSILPVGGPNGILRGTASPQQAGYTRVGHLGRLPRGCPTDTAGPSLAWAPVPGGGPGGAPPCRALGQEQTTGGSKITLKRTRAVCEPGMAASAKQHAPPQRSELGPRALGSRIARADLLFRSVLGLATAIQGPPPPRVAHSTPLGLSNGRTDTGRRRSI